MAINFFGTEKRQKYLIFVLIGLILVILILVWQNFGTKQKTPEVSTTETFQPTKVEINFELLKNPILQELQIFEEIQPFEGKIGRENPFLSY